jgi:carbamoyltransferase
MIVLGVNAPPRGWHDTAACLVIDGEVIAFGEEERFSRVKHAVHQPPHKAASFCLRRAGLRMGDIDVVAVGWNVPGLIAHTPAYTATLNAREYLEYAVGFKATAGKKPEIVYVPHHLAHATCGFYSAPYEEAAILVVDGIGEHESVSMYRATASAGLVRMESWPAPYSLGLLYDAACKSVGLSSLEAG